MKFFLSKGSQLAVLVAFMVFMGILLSMSVPLANGITDEVDGTRPHSYANQTTLETPQVDNRFITAAGSWNYAGVKDLYDQYLGTTTSFSNMETDDGSNAILSEGWDGFNWRFEAIYRTDPIYAHQYISIEAQVEFSQDWTLFPEDLTLYVSLCNADGTPSSWTELGQLGSTAGWSWDVASTIQDTSLSDTRRIAFKVVGTIESGDPGTQNVWRMDYLRIAYKDHLPRLTREESSDDEGGVFYPRYTSSDSRNYMKYYVTIECLDGYSEIQTIKVTYYDMVENAGWEVTWDEGAWSIQYLFADSSWAEIVTPLCTTSVTSSSRTVGFAVRINWGHPSGISGLTNLRISYKTYASSELTADLNYRVESRLAMQTAPSISESRVNAGASATYSGDVEYYGSPSHIAPRNSEVDIQVRRTNPSATDWIYTAQPSNDGGFTVYPSTASSSGTNDFELRVVADGGATNLLTTIYSDSVIGDRVVVTADSTGSMSYNSVYDGGVLNTGETDTLFLKLEWESDGAMITSGTVSWSSSGNTVDMSYDSGDGRWEGTTIARTSVGEEFYDTLSVSVSGVTAVASHPSYKVVWDEIEILSTIIDDSDDYVNIEESVTIQVTAQLKYLGHPLDPSVDTLYMNGVKMNDGGSFFTYIVTHNSPYQDTFSVDLNNAFESTYGISKVSNGGPSVTCTWDTMMIELFVNDSVVNKDDSVRVWAHITRAYDGSTFTGSMGSVVLRHSGSSDILMTYSIVDGAWYADVTQASVGQWAYYVHSITDTAEGINTMGKGAEFDGANDFVNVGSDASLDLTSSLSFAVWFYGTGPNWGSGMYLIAKKDNNNAQYALYIHSDGTLKLVYYNGVLREIAIKSGVTQNAWHNIIVAVSGANLNAWYDGIHVVDDYAMPANLQTFPSVPVYIGAQKAGTGTQYHFKGYISEARIYNIALTDVECELLYRGEYPSLANLVLLLDRASVDVSSSTWYDGSSNNNDGVMNAPLITIGTLPTVSDEYVHLTWNQIRVVSYSSDDTVVSVGSSASMHVSLEYAFDGSPVLEGVVTVNGVSAYPSVIEGEWDFSAMKSSPQGMTYNLVTYSGGRYGLSMVNQNDKSLLQIWDEIIILTTEVEDSFVNIGDQAEIRVAAQLSYLSHNLGIGDTLYMDGMVMNWNSIGGYFYYQPLHSDVGRWNYQVNLTNAFESTYGISAINLNGSSIDVTWDALVISFTDPLDQHINIGENASGISFTVVYASDGVPFDGTAVLNYTTYTHFTAGRHGYSLLPLAGDDSRGITAIFSNDETYCIWNSVSIAFSGPLDQHINIGENASGIIVTVSYDYGTWEYDGEVTLNNSQFTYLTAQKQGYTVSNVFGDSFGITAISSNDETYCIWNSVSIAFNGPLDQHINIGENASGIIVTVSYDYGGFTWDGFYSLNNSQFAYSTAQKQGYSVASVYGDSFGITAISSNDATYCIWDSVSITITDPLDQFINVGENASGIMVAIYYDYGGMSYDGTYQLNNTQFIHWTAQKQGYTVTSVSGDSLGITAISSNDETYCIWESVSIDIVGPYRQTLLLGENASGIIVSAFYDYSKLPYDGQVFLNSTTFSYFTEGTRGYTALFISGDSLGITAISQNDETYATWVDGYPLTIHVNPLVLETLTSTIYDSHNFTAELSMTNETGYNVAGWINITVGGSSFSVYYDGVTNATVKYAPTIAGNYTLKAWHETDGFYGYSETELQGFRAKPRELSYVAEVPEVVHVQAETSFSLIEVYDSVFSGVYDGVTYVNNYPIDARLEAWWSLSYGGPMNHIGSWDVEAGLGFGSFTLPWDLDGNGKLTSVDFECILVINIDGGGVYENATVEVLVKVLQPLQLDIITPTLVYSDPCTFNINVDAMHDPTFNEHLDVNVSLFVSTDNSTWEAIGSSVTEPSGSTQIDWYCNATGTLFFKATSEETEYYFFSDSYVKATAGKEVTKLAILSVGNFTYSDQGTMVIDLATDDGEPVSFYTVFVEMLDSGVWVSIGSGVTNQTGQTSILWTPTLPAGTYNFRVLALFTESQYYLAPANIGASLTIDKESLVLMIDSTNADEGYVRVKVTDDENVTVQGVTVNLFVGDSPQPISARPTDEEGYATFEVSVQDGDQIRAFIEENNYYLSASADSIVVIPPDIIGMATAIGLTALAGLPIMLGVSIIRKKRNAPKAGIPASPEELMEERERVEEGFGETREEYLSALDGSKAVPPADGEMGPEEIE